MAISYNTGVVSSGAQAGTSQAITIPSGVLANDVMILAVSVFDNTGAPALSVSSTGSAWTQMAGAAPNNGNTTGYRQYSAVFYCIAGSSDPGATVTVTNANGSGFWELALVSYTGASTSNPIDVRTWYGPYGQSSVGTINCPQLVTRANNEWAIYVASNATNTATTGPSGSTQRQNAVSGNGMTTAIFDSNGSVGNAGTTIGGGAFTGGVTTWVAWTIGLMPAGGTIPASISLNDHGAIAQSATSSGFTFTIPGGVLAGDVMIIGVDAFINSAPTLTISSTGSSWTQLGSTIPAGAAGYSAYGAVFYCVAGSTDAGKVVTINNTASGDPYYTLVFAAYSGARTSLPIDVSGFTATTSNTTVTCPSKTTGANNDWAVYVCNAGPLISGFPANTFYRDEADASGTSTVITDSGTNVGLSGTSIGGGTFTSSNGSGGFVAWTIGLQKATSSGLFIAASII
jgi:hypothetical protein